MLATKSRLKLTLKSILLELKRVAHEQKEDIELRKLTTRNQKPGPDKGKRKPIIKTKVINDVEVVTYNDRIYIPSSLRKDTMNWYHHYLQHPGASRMERTLGSVVYWPGMSKDICQLCTTCKIYQFTEYIHKKQQMENYQSVT